MRIKVISSNFNKEKIKDGHFIESVLDEIFLISKSDPNFIKDEKITKNEEELITLSNKLEKQKSILDKSNEFEKEIDEKLSILDEEINEEKSKILNNLGSEL